MPLNIETFSNIHGGNAFFKAISHPQVAAKVEALLAALKEGPVAVYDPLQQAEAFSRIYTLRMRVAGYFVQNIDHLSKSFAAQKAQPVTELKSCKTQNVFIAAFDAGRFADQIRHLLPPGAKVYSFDALRIPDELVTDSKNYLSPMNFATKIG